MSTTTEKPAGPTAIRPFRDGQVHFSILPGSVEKNRHLVGRTLA